MDEPKYLKYLENKYLAKSYSITALCPLVKRTDAQIRNWASIGRKTTGGPIFLQINEDEAGGQYVTRASVIEFFFDLRFGPGAYYKNKKKSI
jgi:hypothetical protein